MGFQDACRKRLLTGCSIVFLTANAFRSSGTEHIIAADFNICLTDILIALSGTSSNF